MLLAHIEFRSKKSCMFSSTTIDNRWKSRMMEIL